MTTASTRLIRLTTRLSVVICPWATLDSRDSTESAPRTVATMRAQLRPLALAEAIHSHSPTEMRPTTTAMLTATVTAVSICWPVRVVLLLRRALATWLRRLSRVEPAGGADTGLAPTTRRPAGGWTPLTCAVTAGG